MNCPAEVYTPAIRRYRGLPELAYPFHDCVIRVTNCGRICLHRKKINLSTVFAGQTLGIKSDAGRWCGLGLAITLSLCAALSDLRDSC
jgi:hypothetical protein